nr:helix-turn-helix domain-containing protein [Halocatena marina]
MDIVETLRELNGAGVPEVDNQLDIPTSTVHNHLRTLTREECPVKKGSTHYVSTQSSC